MRIELPCGDLDEALAYFTGELGFRLDSIAPADDPRVAMISGHGIEVRLERFGERLRTEGWVEGRAGMRYRNLVREGPLVISHIRIEQGGPVPDYVHYHAIAFQLIYCLKGWVKVVYEDQGPPFVMEPGDWVIQPPRIRHRVLECSAGLEVIEISSPADHETFVDHELVLPTPVFRPDRDFGGQRFQRGRG